MFRRLIASCSRFPHYKTRRVYLDTPNPPSPKEHHNCNFSILYLSWVVLSIVSVNMSINVFTWVYKINFVFTWGAGNSWFFSSKCSVLLTINRNNRNNNVVNNKELEYSCYVCENVVKVRDYIEHLEKHYNDKSLYLTCCMCGVNKHNSYYRFRNAKCRLCIYLHTS